MLPLVLVIDDKAVASVDEPRPCLYEVEEVLVHEVLHRRFGAVLNIGVGEYRALLVREIGKQDSAVL